MEGFREGFQFFSEHASDFLGVGSGSAYVDSVNTEIDALLKNMAEFAGKNSRIDTLKGDIAEFWHSGTFNINAAVKGSGHRTEVLRSHDFGSVDVKAKNFDGNFGLKYYKTGGKSAEQQAKSVFAAFKRYQADGGKESLDEYLKNRGFQNDSIINDPVYLGQVRVIPSDQMGDAISWLERKIATEKAIRSDQVKRYEETLKLLKDRVSDNKGVESIPLSEEDAKKLAKLAKDNNIDPKELGLTTEELIKYKYIMKESLKAGLTAATISLVLKTTPEIINAIKYLIENGEIEEGEFEKIGLAAVTGASEGFVRGTVAASITAACRAGALGEAMKTIDASVVGAVTVLAMDTMKNAYSVARGEMSRYEMSNELIKTMFTSTCALVLGSITQGIIDVPVLGYMIGSFVGSMVGSYAFSTIYKPAISFCVDTGITFFGLVDQDYKLPEDVMREIGMDVFDYETFDYSRHEHEKFEYKTFTADKFEPEKIDMTFLHRGVIGIGEIGYI